LIASYAHVLCRAGISVFRHSTSSVLCKCNQPKLTPFLLFVEEARTNQHFVVHHQQEMSSSSFFTTSRIPTSRLQQRFGIVRSSALRASQESDGGAAQPNSAAAGARSDRCTSDIWRCCRALRHRRPPGSKPRHQPHSLTAMHSNKERRVRNYSSPASPQPTHAHRQETMRQVDPLVLSRTTMSALHDASSECTNAALRTQYLRSCQRQRARRRRPTRRRSTGSGAGSHSVASHSIGLSIAPLSFAKNSRSDVLRRVLALHGRQHCPLVRCATAPGVATCLRRVTLAVPVREVAERRSSRIDAVTRQKLFEVRCGAKDTNTRNCLRSRATPRVAASAACDVERLFRQMLHASPAVEAWAASSRSHCCGDCTTRLSSVRIGGVPSVWSLRRRWFIGQTASHRLSC